MPSFFRYIVLVLSATLLFSACKKSELSGPEDINTITPPSPTSLDFTITGNYRLGTVMSFNAVNANNQSLTWNFGNGKTAKGASATTVYYAAGTFTVKLTVDNDASKTASKTITIVNTPTIPIDMAKITTTRRWFKTLSLTDANGTSIIGYDTATYALVNNKDTITIPGETKFANFADPQQLKPYYSAQTQSNYTFYGIKSPPQTSLTYYALSDSIVYSSSYTIYTPGSGTYKLTCVAGK